MSVHIRKVLRPAIATQIFLGFLCVEANVEKIHKFHVIAASDATLPISFR
jgi:hypothetical protein